MWPINDVCHLYVPKIDKYCGDVQVEERKKEAGEIERVGVREKDGERKTERERGGKSEGERERIMPTSRKPDEFVDISIHRSVDFIYNVFWANCNKLFTGWLQIGWFWTTC